MLRHNLSRPNVNREAKQGAHSLSDGVGGLAADAQALEHDRFKCDHALAFFNEGDSRFSSAQDART
jgi:hypothetical protein